MTVSSSTLGVKGFGRKAQTRPGFRLVCKNIRDADGSWSQLEVFISDHSHADFTHGMCPECAADVK